MPGRRRVAMLVIAALPSLPLVVLADPPSGDRRDLRDARSRYVDIRQVHFSTVTTLFPSAQPGQPSPVRPRINMTFRNTSKRALWLVAQLTPPPPAEHTRRVSYLEPREQVDFEATQDSIVAGVDYLVDVVLFADEALKDTLEINRLRMLFDEPAVKALDERLRLRRQEGGPAPAPAPQARTFRDIAIRDKVGLASFVIGPIGSLGTLTVTSDSIAYVSKKRVFTLPADRLVRARNPGDEWVALEYDEGSGTKTIWFGAYANASLVNEVEASLDALIAFHDGRREAAAKADAPAPVDEVGWPADSLAFAICTADSQQASPVLVGDGSGGAIVMWRDHRHGEAAIYAHRILPTGAPDPGWPRDGRLVASRVNSPSRAAVTDGAGGAIVGFRRGSGAHAGLFAQRVLVDGTVDPAWPADGRRLTHALGHKECLHLVADGGGGAIVVWEDMRHDTSGAYRHLYAQHVLAGGALDPEWPPDGRALYPTDGPGSRGRFPSKGSDAVSDGAGGVIVTWASVEHRHLDIYVQHVLASGRIDSAWPANGRAVCEAKNNQQRPRMIADGAGGVVIAWEDGRGAGFKRWNAYAQHVMANGAVDSAWPADGLRVSPVRDNQDFVEVVPDGAGGAILAWRDDRDSNEARDGGGGFSHTYAQHLLASGSVAPGWPKTGLRAYERYSRMIVSDHAGGAILFAVSQDTTGMPRMLHAQHVLNTGSLDPAWPPEGRIVTVLPPEAGVLDLGWIEDGTGGVLIAFESRKPLPAAHRGDPTWKWQDIHARHFLPNGTRADTVEGRSR